MKICSFNVNSVRARLELIVTWLEHRNNDIDVLCLQEIKVTENNFPHKAFEELGFNCEVYGQKGYNGVAICAKTPLVEVTKGFGAPQWDSQKRLILGKMGALKIMNVYVPHGDFRGTKKHFYKLAWLTRCLRYLQINLSAEEKLIVVGDFNIARNDLDVYNSVILEDTIGTMPEEREAFENLLGFGLIDTFRCQYSDKRGYTWWDYIGGAIWRDEGMRIDYILCSKFVIDHLIDVEIDLWPRKRRKPTPSDHAPVIGTFRL